MRAQDRVESQEWNQDQPRLLLTIPFGQLTDAQRQQRECFGIGTKRTCRRVRVPRKFTFLAKYTNSHDTTANVQKLTFFLRIRLRSLLSRKPGCFFEKLLAHIPCFLTKKFLLHTTIWSCL